MKNLVMIVAVGALAACQSEPAEEPEAAEVETVAVESYGPDAGTWELSDADGNTSNWAVAEDGSFTATGADGQTRTGRFTSFENGRRCYDFNEDEEGELCATEVVNDDGSMTITDSDGSVATARRTDAAAADPMATEPAAAEPVTTQ